MWFPLPDLYHVLSKVFALCAQQLPFTWMPLLLKVSLIGPFLLYHSWQLYVPLPLLCLLPKTIKMWIMLLTTLLDISICEPSPMILLHSFKQKQLSTFMANAPDYVKPHLPMLLNCHTSEALLCMSHHCHDQWLSPPYFHLIFCHKLCLPIYSGTRPTCACSKPLDEFGDHFFSCQCYYSKMTTHNAIRDALHLIVSEIGTHAGLIASRSYVQCEQLNLAHCYPTSRPGDLVVECMPTYVSPPALPFSHVAIDIHVTGSLTPPSGRDQNPMVTITHHHQKVEREKFCGPSVNTESTFVNGEMVI